MSGQLEVQRKLQFHVRKTTRSTHSKSVSENRDPALSNGSLSPRKRNTTSTLNVKQIDCSPRKKKKEPVYSQSLNVKPIDYVCSPVRRSETPTRYSRTKVIFDCSTDTFSPKKTDHYIPSGITNVRSERIPLSPRKDLVRNENTPHKISGRNLFLSSENDSNVEYTPSTVTAKRLSRLLLSPGKSPASKNNTPAKVRLTKGRKLLLSPRKDCLTKPSTPARRANTLNLQRPDGEAYLRAKQSFHTSKPNRLVGRDSETKQIMTFVEGHLSNNTAGSIYISGAPGTGKTAVLSHIMEKIQNEHMCKTLYLNCMTLRDSATVYSKLYADISGKSTSSKDRMKAVERVLSSSGPGIILVLDEIDQLDSKNQEILYTIFEWPTLPNSRLILIGIANALDLTDRILPRLQARPKCKPHLLNFAPYSKDQIASILKDRLHDLEEDGVSVMEPSALQFCARKISAIAGDLRKALDVCRRSIEMVEIDVRSQQVFAVTKPDCSSPNKLPKVPKKISIVHINKVLSDVYGSSATASQQDTIPLQQKLVVCTLLLVLKQGKMKEVLLGKLHETYCKICKKRQMAALDNSEFQSVCMLLESRGILGLKKAKESRLAKVTMKLDEDELEHTLQDKVLVSSILQDGFPK